MPSFSTPALRLSVEKAEPLHAKLLPPLSLGNSYPSQKEAPSTSFSSTYIESMTYALLEECECYKFQNMERLETTFRNWKKKTISFPLSLHIFCFREGEMERLSLIKRNLKIIHHIFFIYCFIFQVSQFAAKLTKKLTVQYLKFLHLYPTMVLILHYQENKFLFWKHTPAFNPNLQNMRWSSSFGSAL